MSAGLSVKKVYSYYKYGLDCHLAYLRIFLGLYLVVSWVGVVVLQHRGGDPYNVQFTHDNISQHLVPLSDPSRRKSTSGTEQLAVAPL